MNFTDSSRCSSCSNTRDYSALQDTSNYTCDQKCICRFENQRSTKDQMDYQIFVLGKPLDCEGQEFGPNSGNDPYLSSCMKSVGSKAKTFGKEGYKRKR